jgi:SAM-dependent methyltransferase
MPRQPLSDRHPACTALGMADTIYARPAQYDLEHVGDDLDVAFYRQLARMFDARRVLELGCGSGRVTIPLVRDAATRECEVVGVDLSAEMLAEAAAKATVLPEEIRARLRLVEGDLAEWHDEERFDVIIVPCSTLSHLLTLPEQLRAWTRAHDNLRPGGRFVVDVTMPDLASYADSMQQPPRALLQLDVDANTPGGERLIRYKVTRYLPHLQRARIHFLYDAFGSNHDPGRFVSDFEGHVYFPRELELLFRVAGFEVEATWGDYRFGPFDATSRQIIMVGRRPI